MPFVITQLQGAMIARAWSHSLSPYKLAAMKAVGVRAARRTVHGVEVEHAGVLLAVWGDGARVADDAEAPVQVVVHRHEHKVEREDVQHLPDEQPTGEARGWCSMQA